MEHSRRHRPEDSNLLAAIRVACATLVAMRAALAIALAAGCAACTPSAARVEPERRVVLVTIDTLRFDALHGGGGRETAMPKTQAWAREATVFERFFSASTVTQSAHASLLTGLAPWRHGVTRNGLVLAGTRETLPEVLSAAGWRTGAVVASFPLTRAMGFDQGFLVFVERFDVRMGRAWNELPVEEFYSLGRETTDRALALLDELSGESQFLWVHYFDPHAPYGDAAGVEPLLFPKLQRAVFDRPGTDEAEDALARARELYARDVAALDGELARLLRRLAADAERVETHVVLTADHGESFGEHGSLGHGRRLTAPELHVPLVVHSPRFLRGVRSEPVGSVDVAATLAALAGVPWSAELGRDLSGSLERDGRVVGMRATFAEPVVDERTDGTRATLAGPRWFAFDDGVLWSGDGETVVREDDELAPAPPALAARLRELFAGFAGETEEASVLEDAGAHAALRELGYAE